MTMKIRTIAILGALLGAVTLGCSGEDHGPHDGHDHGAHDHDHDGCGDGCGDETGKIDAAMAELSPEDRALATRQETCPVSGEPLGSMGTPIKVMVQERPVFICCEGCRKRLLRDAQKYLDMLER